MNSTYGFGYGEDAKQQMLDDAREVREQDEANALAFEEAHMRQEINRATAMLWFAGIKPKVADVELLARAILEVAAELAGDGDPAFYVADAARELEKRIGGNLKKTLPGYMGVLRAAAPRSAA
jgi:hypothetical protein